MSINDLRQVAAEAKLFIEPNAIDTQRLTVWSQIEKTLSQRIATSPQAEVIEDGAVSWVRATVQPCSKVKKSIGQILGWAPVEASILGPGDKEYSNAAPQQPAYLVWSNSAVDITAEAKKRTSANAKILPLSSSMALLQDALPQRVASHYLDYSFLPDPLIPLPETKNRVQAGIDDIFASINKSTAEVSPADRELLEQIKTFWERDVAFATLNDNDGIVTFAGSPTNKAAYLVIVPPGNHNLNKAETFSSNVNNGLPISLVKPIDIKQAWFGSSLLHELVHMHDYQVGNMSPSKTRTEQVDSEYRAFSAQIAAAELCSNGAFKQAIKKFVEQTKPTLPNIIDALTEATNKFNILEQLELIDNELMMFTKPQTNAAAATRCGFYGMACAFYILEQNHQNDELIAKKKEFIEVVYGTRGNLVDQ